MRHFINQLLHFLLFWICKIESFLHYFDALYFQVIFATLGYMSELTNKPVSEVVGDGDSSLIFVVYPQAIATMSYSNVWSMIFFLMLITLGIDSTVCFQLFEDRRVFFAVV